MSEIERIEFIRSDPVPRAQPLGIIRRVRAAPPPTVIRKPPKEPKP